MLPKKAEVSRDLIIFGFFKKYFEVHVVAFQNLFEILQKEKRKEKKRGEVYSNLFELILFFICIIFFFCRSI